MSTKLLIISVLTGMFALTACAKKSEQEPVESSNVDEKNTEVHTTDAKQVEPNIQDSEKNQTAEQNELTDSFEAGEIEKTVEENQQF